MAEVALPKITLRLEHLAYLRLLKEGPRPPRRQWPIADRLLAVGLIAEVKVHPTSEQLRKARQERNSAKRRLAHFLAENDWDEAGSVCDELARLECQMEPSVRYALTDEGRRFLAHGRVIVRLAEQGKADRKAAK